MKSEKINHRLAGWAGMIAPVLFVAVFWIEGILRSGYDSRSMYISALSLGPHGRIQMGNFMVFGLLLGYFTWGIASAFCGQKAAHAGVVLLWILSALFFISGPFVMDPAGTPLEESTIHGIIHGLAGGIVFLLMPASMFAFLLLFRKNSVWSVLRGWTIGIGSFEAAAVVAFTIISKSPTLLSTFAGWIGLTQRLALVPFMIWIYLFAAKFKNIDPIA